jgi:hypothetical protein
MSAPAGSFVTYVWHYVLARLIYDEVVRGRGGRVLIVVGCIGVGSYLLGAWSGRRRR